MKTEKEFSNEGSGLADMLTLGSLGLSNVEKCTIRDSETGEKLSTGWGDSKSSAEKDAERNLNESNSWW